MSRRTLPVATLDRRSRRQVQASCWRRHRRPLVVMLVLNGFAALAGLAGPRLLGEMVESLRDGTTRGHLDRLAVLLALALVAQTVLTWFARRAGFVRRRDGASPTCARTS